MKNIFLILFLIGFCNISSGQDKSRPMEEMHGDCSAFKMNLSKELRLWSKKAVNTKTSEPLSFGQKVSLQLAPQEQVKFIAPPGKTFPVNGKSYGGVFSFAVPRAGKYRVSAGAKVWFDVVNAATKKPIEANEFEMQTSCDKIFKTVIFYLELGPYALQINSSSSDLGDFLITSVE